MRPARLRCLDAGRGLWHLWTQCTAPWRAGGAQVGL